MSDDQQPFLRPFLSRPVSPSAARSPETVEDFSETPVVRAYMMTAGAASANVVALAFESMVSLTAKGKAASPNLQFERGKIAKIVADHVQSVAEIAATLRIPLGVTQVLCGDMVGAELLEHHKSNANLSDDVSLLTRLINGVRSL